MNDWLDDSVKRPCAFVIRINRPSLTSRKILDQLHDRNIRVDTMSLHCTSEMEGILIIHCLIERDRVKHVHHQLEKVHGIIETELLESKTSISMEIKNIRWKEVANLTCPGRLEKLWTMVGNTPMLEILYEYKGQTRRIYAKCEHYNLTGSIKDRMALYILQRAYAENKIKPGDRIVEATSGNTGISFAAIGRALGHPVTIIMPDWLSEER